MSDAPPERDVLSDDIAVKLGIALRRDDRGLRKLDPSDLLESGW